MIELRIRPRTSVDWDTFLATHPPYSIALDGYVRGKPRFTADGPYASYDHHAEVDRLGTRSTCAQVYVALKQGLLEVFQERGEPTAKVWINDPDQDTCVAWWLLTNADRVEGERSEPLITRLIMVEDLLDTTAGAYPLGADTAVMQELAWIFDPYTAARMEGQLAVMDEAGMKEIVTAVCWRITQYSLGAGERLSLDTRYEEIGGGPGWKMILEQGAHARSEIFSAGARAFVSVRKVEGGGWIYSIGKMSPYVMFPIEQLYQRLNDAEGLTDADDTWGGGDTIGGSPRAGSQLPPAELQRIINGALQDPE